MKKKLPAHQTILDFCIQDGIIIWLLRMVCTNICFYIGLLYGKLNVDKGIFLVGLQAFLFTLQASFVQIALVLKTILIFKGDLITKFTEEALMWGYRGTILVYSLFFFGIGIIFPKNTNPFMLYFMTGSKTET